MPTAASSSVIDSGRSRTPVAIADSPRATDRNRGTAKNSPACNRYWKKNAVRPPRNTGFRRIAGSTRGSAPWASRRFSHSMNTQSTTPPPSISQIEGDRPSHSGADALGRTKPHSPARRMPNTISPRPSADSAVPTRSSRTRVSGVGVGHAAGEREDRGDDEHLAHEHPAPRQVGREEAADEGAGGDRDGAGRRHQPVGPRPLGCGRSWMATSATMAGRISAAPMPSRNDHPRINTPRFGEIAVTNDPQP